MSELTNTRDRRAEFYLGLLATVSAATLLTFLSAGNEARAAGDNPSLWVELGGQLAQQQQSEDAFLPPFVLATPRPPLAVISPQEAEKSSPFGGSGTAKIAFEPEDSDWILSADIAYGRSGRTDMVNQQTPNPTPYIRPYAFATAYIAYQRITSRNTQSHVVVDFKAGRDFGIGILGKDATSTLSFGVRYTQFDSKSEVAIASQPTNVNVNFDFHKHFADFSSNRKYTGIGPAISWDASANLIGDSTDGGISFDWGLNGAVLFGRQNIKGHYQTRDLLHRHYTAYDTNYYGSKDTIAYQHSASPNRGKRVVVPNLGGFAGVSWRYPNAKVSLGYRADFFFGAMDGGINTQHSRTIGFYGPFASVSVGVGD